MRIRLTRALSLFIFVALLATSCKKDDAPVTAPAFSFSAVNDTINSTIKEPVKIEARLISGSGATSFSWWVNDKLVSEKLDFEYVFDTAGHYTIIYKAANNGGIFEKKFVADVQPIIRQGGLSPYVSTLFEFMPAPGQFINKAPGNLVSAEGLLGKTGMVSLGAWGGYVIYGFDHSVPDKEGNDIDVTGNALAEWSEPGIIYVMADDNGNGKPDDTWYELAGSEFDKTDGTYLRDYQVTYYRPESADKDIAWTDNKGNTGFVKRNTFHRQAYYPEWITANSYTLKGSWLKTKIDPSRPSYIVSLPYDWGYADNQTEASGGGKVDISNAVDVKGNKVSLKAIDFIKIQTGTLADGGWLGEASTEVTGIKDLHFSVTNN